MTFSIVAYDPKTGDLGVAVQSKFISVGVIVPWAKINVGAIATQAMANTEYGYKGLELLEQGFTAQEVLNQLIENDPEREHRQIGIVDGKGNAAAFTGSECFYWAGNIVGKHFTVQGNILVSEETIQEMAKAFEFTEGDLPTKLLAALKSADQEGRGDARGQQSASLLVVRDKGGYGEYTDRWIDIRVDEHPEPIKELERIFHIYDYTFLTRENPSNLFEIQGEIAENIKSILVELNYLPLNKKTPGDQWSKIESKALEAWVGVNNFENKWQTGKIWKSMYDYMIKEKGTPIIHFKKMNE